MKYVVIEAPGVVNIRDCEKPVAQPGEVLLRILYGGLCGSDVGTYKGTFAYVAYPRVPGHEFSAVIEEISEKDSAEYGLAKGMVVTANPYFNCGHCYCCNQGFVNSCMSNETMGAQKNGAFYQYITMPAHRVYDGKGLDAKTLALIEPFCISYHAVQLAHVKAGEKVLVFGSGPIGLLAQLGAQMMGAEVTMADVVGSKLQAALDNGAAHVIDLTKEDLAVRTAEITGDIGFQVCLEAAGTPEALVSSVESAAFHGRVVVVGISKRNVDLTYSLIQKKELVVYGSRNALKSDFVELIDLLCNNADMTRRVNSLVTLEVPFEEATAAFADIADPLNDNIKAIMRF